MEAEPVVMEQVLMKTAEPPVSQPPLGKVSRVLASGISDDLRIDVVQFEDQSLGITFDRRPRLGYRWAAGQIEPCVNAFMRLMRH
jgi:hypothetical protein